MNRENKDRIFDELFNWGEVVWAEEPDGSLKIKTELGWLIISKTKNHTTQ